MDHTIFRWINNLALHVSWANGTVKLYAKAGIAIFAALLILAYLDARRRDDHQMLATVVWTGGAALAALGIAQLIGRSVDRARPYESMKNVHLLVARTTDFSFPSDHATVAGAVAAGLLLASRRWGTVAAVAAVAMAFARVYVGAHYPGDVVAGLAVGGIVAVAGRYLIVPPLRRLFDLLATTPIRLLFTSAPGQPSRE
jgi:undecaprenyl-diphosphatase